MITSDVKQDIARLLADVPEVESVYIDQHGDLFEVYTIVGVDDDDVYDRIYGRERIVIRTFRDAHFDFNVIDRRGRPESEVMGSMIPVWRRSESHLPCLNSMST